MAKPPYGATLNTADALTANLVALYLLNETAGTVVHDLTTNALDSTSSSGLDWATTPNNLTLDGSTTFASMGTNSLLAVGGTSRSFEVMFRLDAQVNGVAPILIHRVLYPPPYFFGYQLQVTAPDDPTHPSQVAFGTGFFASVPSVVWGSTTIVTGVDYHVVAVQNVFTGFATVYVNGSNVGSGFISNPGTPSATFEIGRSPAPSNYFPGVLRKVAVYGTDLSSSDVSSLYADPWQQAISLGLQISVSPDVSFGVNSDVHASLAVRSGADSIFTVSIGMRPGLAVSTAPNVQFTDSSEGMAVSVQADVQFSTSTALQGAMAVSVPPNVLISATLGLQASFEADGTCDVQFVMGDGVHAPCIVSDGLPHYSPPSGTPAGASGDASFSY